MKEYDKIPAQADFNSIKVRLERLALRLLRLRYPDFNSIKVRLEPVKSWA